MRGKCTHYDIFLTTVNVLGESGILGSEADLPRHWQATDGLWALSLLCELLLKIYRLFRAVSVQLPHRSTTDSENDAATSVGTGQKNRAWLRRILLGMFRNLCDFVFAVHFLPKGWLWGGRIPQLPLALLGFTSSLIRIDESWNSLCC